jgi:putative DNA primase/helicase
MNADNDNNSVLPIVANDNREPSLAAAINDAFVDEKNELNEAKQALGFGDKTLDEFLALSIEELDQAKGSHVLPLQQRCQDFLKRKQEADKTIRIEPSKLHEAVEKAERLLRMNDDHIYQRAGTLVKVGGISGPINGTKDSSMYCPHDAVRIKEIDKDFLTMHLTKIGNFVRFDSRSESLKKIDCPDRISRHLLAKDAWDLPTLTGIINAPTLRSNGSLLDKPGYDVQSGLLFLPGDCDFDTIPASPTHNDALRAKSVLLDLLKDFPFEDDISKAVALAAICTALVRRSLPAAPLMGLTAPKMASGKSLLADVIALIATGKNNNVITPSDSEAEEKKRLMSLLLAGDGIICYDNVDKPLGGSTLCVILTQSTYKDRLLGGNQTRTVPTNATILATGNNLTFTGDLSTRALLCKLDPLVERPEERSFDRGNLRRFVLENRSSLVGAALTILYAYQVAGKPPQNIKPFGRFEEWNDFIRSALIWAEMADPCESRKEIEDADPVRIVLNSLFFAWHTLCGQSSIKVKDLIDKAFAIPLPTDDAQKVGMQEMLKEALFELAGEGKVKDKGDINPRILAKKLAVYKNRIENGLRLESDGRNQGTTLWRMRKM